MDKISSVLASTDKAQIAELKKHIDSAGRIFVAGAGRSKLVSSFLAMIAALNTGAKISVAGGVKAATAQQVKDAGASIIVAGAAIYGAADPAASAAEITAIAH